MLLLGLYGDLSAEPSNQLVKQIVSDNLVAYSGTTSKMLIFYTGATEKHKRLNHEPLSLLKYRSWEKTALSTSKTYNEVPLQQSS